MKSKGDKYSGLVTALAVLVVVFYTEGKYDEWDIFLGLIGFGLAWKYKSDIDKSDIFFTLLVSALFALSSVAVVFGIAEKSDELKSFLTQTPFGSSFVNVLLITGILTFVFHSLSWISFSKIIDRRNLPALSVTLQAVKSDNALHKDGRGARKLLVTELYPKTEEKATEVDWKAHLPSGKCPVQVMKDSEFAFFTHGAKQDRHYHKKGTEIYMVLEGNMKIEVEGIDYDLSIGDMIIVNPKAVHEVKPEKGTEFLCRVLTVNCGGESDKYLGQ